MASQALVDMLTEKFQQGFIHPGDPARDVPPTPIILPFKPSPGQPKEMADLMTGTAKLLAECVVAAIEESSEIVERDEARTLRKAAGEAPDGPQFIPVYCHCDRKRERPLAVLTAGPPDRFVVNGPALLRGLTGLDVRCPHGAPTMPESIELRNTVVDTMDAMLKRDVSAKGRARITDVMDEFLTDVMDEFLG